MGLRVDWSKRSDYIWRRHGVRTSWADEAVNEGHAVWLRPDPASESGFTVRVIGYSPGAGAVLTVILLNLAADPDEHPDGDWWGANAWSANDRDRSIYREGERREQD
jgi:hypothetical protein